MLLRVLSCSLILVLASAPGFAQTSTHAATQPGTAVVNAAASVPAIPKDPTQLMLLASRVNGLGSLEAHPWHVKADFQTFDADGKANDQGVFEEWWAGPEKYKISFSSKGFSQVLYRNGDKRLITGDSRWTPGEQRMAQELLLQPMPTTNEIGTQKYVGNSRKIGQVSLECLRLDAPVASVFCTDKDVPAIRVKADYLGFTTYFNEVVSANDHYVAKQLRVQQDGKPYLNEDVTVLQFPPSIDDAEFVAPASAVPAPGPLPTIGAGVMAGNRISGKDPRYPSMAKSARVQGKVVLDAVINKEGAIDDLRVVSGPTMLQESALNAVHTWRYKPYTLNGKPVEVETQINVVYVLSQ